MPIGVNVTGVQRRQFKSKPTIVFGYLGYPLTHKGIDVLIDAFRTLNQAKAQLQIWGGAPENVIEMRRRLTGLNARVSGRYSREQLPKILSGIDVVVVPSICREVGPFVISEAFAAGIPVIVSDAGSQREYVQNNENGLHFRTGDPKDLSQKMNRFIQDPELVGKLSRHIPIVRTLSEEAEEVEKVYKQLIIAKRSERSQKSTLLRTLSELRGDILVRNLEYGLSQQQTELDGIRNSLGYKWVHFYGSKIDQLLPNGTTRGKFKQKMTKLLRVAAGV
jgi:glycosyltransferase involved in cell wall biosynthesis